MAFTIRAKNIMLDAIARLTNPAAAVDRVGVFNKQANKSGTATASSDLINITAHGYSAGDVIVFTTLTGGAGLSLNVPYFVIAAGLVANAFSVSTVAGGSAVNITTDYSAVTGARYVEPGAPYARKAIAWNAPAEGTIDDSTNGAVIDVPATVAVDAEGGWNNSTGDLLIFTLVTQVPGDAANWTYTITDADLTIT